MPMRIVTVKLPDIYVEILDEMVKRGKYPSRSEAIREAVRRFIESEFNWNEVSNDVKVVRLEG